MAHAEYDDNKTFYGLVAINGGKYDKPFSPESYMAEMWLLIFQMFFFLFSTKSTFKFAQTVYE